jgi:hypothetical protein
MSPNVSKASKAIVFIISPFVSMPFIYEASTNHFINLRSVPFYFFRRSREPFVKRPRIHRAQFLRRKLRMVSFVREKPTRREIAAKNGRTSKLRSELAVRNVL